MYQVFKIDLLDTFIYADIFEEEKYMLLAQSDNLENLVQFSMSEFRSLNKRFKTFEEWQEEAEDGGYEVEIFHDASSLFRGSMLLIDPMIEKAMNLALKYHKNVKRKGDGLPYIIHILNISALIYRNGRPKIDPDILAAGICHDLLEDTDCPEQEIKDTCNPEVLRIVKAVSNDPKLESFEDWEKKKENYITSVEAGGKKAMTVCICDKIANMNALFAQYEKEGETLWSKFNRGKEKKLWFEKAVLSMLKQNNFESPYLEMYEKMIEKLETLK